MIEFDASSAIMYELMIDWEAAIWLYSDEYETADVLYSVYSFLFDVCRY